MNIKQAKIKIEKFFWQHKRMPSYREICQLFSFASKKAAYDLVQKLIQLGWVEQDKRGRLIPKNIFPTIPLLGSIQAGKPVDAWQQNLGTVTIGQYFPGDPSQAYALRVNGDSMIEAGIWEGDLVIVEKGKEPKIGDIVVAYIDNECTLKKLYKINNQYYLKAANSKYKDIYPKSELAVFGVVKTVLRNY